MLAEVFDDFGHLLDEILLETFSENMRFVDNSIYHYLFCRSDGDKTTNKK